MVNAYANAESDYKRAQADADEQNQDDVATDDAAHDKALAADTLQQATDRALADETFQQAQARYTAIYQIAMAQALHDYTCAPAEGVDPDTAETNLQNAEQQAADDYQQNMAKPTGDHEKALAQADLDFANNTARDDAAWVGATSTTGTAGARQQCADTEADRYQTMADHQASYAAAVDRELAQDVADKLALLAKTIRRRGPRWPRRWPRRRPPGKPACPRPR